MELPLLLLEEIDPSLESSKRLIGVGFDLVFLGLTGSTGDSSELSSVPLLACLESIL